MKGQQLRASVFGHRKELGEMSLGGLGTSSWE
jgi:hypothetical protein